MATLVSKPKSLFFYHLSKNKKLLSLVFLAILLFTGLVIGAVVIHKELKQLRRLRHDLSATQFAVSQYKRQVSQLSHDDDLRISKLQQAWTDVESKLRNQDEHIKKLNHLLSQQSLHPDMREANLLQELQVHKDMYVQAQQRIRSYEQQLVALTHEMKELKEQNQLIRQEQVKIIAEHLESLSQEPQVDQEQEPLKESLDLRFSQLTNADYELDQKLQDVQKAVESCAKIGELKALEVYYDDKLENLSRGIQKSANSQVKNSSNNEQFKQVQQDLMKIAQEEEGIKAAFSQLDRHQKNNEERLKALENQDHLNVLSARPVDAPLSPQKALEEAVKNYNALSKSGTNKKELKEAKKQIKQLHRQINQQPQEIYQNTLNQKKPEENKVHIEEIFDQEPYETQFGNDLANIIHAFVDLYHDM